MPPEYHLQSFWDSRFKTESHFEWLGDGQHTLIPQLRTFLRSQQQSNPSETPPRVLHIGAGTSTLSDRIREVYYDVYGDTMGVGSHVIVNTDYAETAVQRGVEAEIARAQEQRGGGVRWVQTDILKWKDIAQLVDISPTTGGHASGRNTELFAAVMDKSTSDAIACGADIRLDELRTRADIHPTLEAYLAEHDAPPSMHPIELLSLHLASLVRPGGVWISLSYSPNRFPSLKTELGTNGREDRAGVLRTSRYWDMEICEAVAAPSGMSKAGVHAPTVHDYVYVLRRTDNI
ncbi:uncharacterized protein FIBRA_06637 [Fibroporia radiculosa]|uniref:Histidine-specific methyltransferase SAM-dependent domain-containing protein n=1 Tax=Fibroporia radiculosa TaxID=599839 RepID=J4HZF3_9APHY|nr:uncharacterized protein FIBRA_06637 [Fibroporia radiculosa]CCM04457.1 predicted protein [Fibroporia radiculosa]